MATKLQMNRVAVENDGPRVDAILKVTGAAKYTRDISLPNMTYARYVRSPWANAKLVSKNEAAAKAIKGVLDIGFAREEAEYMGQSVGHVCAESDALCYDAIAALELKWEITKEPVTNLRRETRGGRLPEAKDQAMIDAALAKAAHVVESTYETQQQHHVSLETHCAVVQPLPGNKGKAWCSTQTTFGVRDGLARPLGVERNDMEVECGFVGGGFGSKFSAGIEGKLAAEMAKKFNRPCKVVNNRKEESVDTGLRPGTLQKFHLGVAEDGKITGGRVHGWSSVGHRRGGGSIAYCDYNLGDVEKPQRRGVSEVQLSACAARPQRAPGHPQAAFALESVLDELAAKIGMDPIEFRKLNDNKPDHARQFEMAKKVVDWDQRVPDGTSPGVVKRGFGCGAAQWQNFGFPANSVEIRIYPEGKLEVRSGTQDIGTGHRTMMVDLAAHGTGVDRSFIVGLTGNTEYPRGPGSGGSVCARAVAPAILAASELAKAEILALVARDAGGKAEDYEIKGDQVVTGGAAKMSWLEACKLIGDDHLSVTAKGDKKFRGSGGSDGVAIAEVKVDTETGEVKLVKLAVVQQCGLPVNRRTVESQIAGAAIQGIGYTMFEDKVINVANGAVVNANMESYKLPGPADMPELIPILDVGDDQTAVRALGEPPIVGVPGAIANAVANAIGARVASLPITPAKVLEALSKKGASA